MKKNKQHKKMRSAYSYVGIETDNFLKRWTSHKAIVADKTKWS